MGSLIGGFNPTTLFQPKAETAPQSGVCKGIDVKASDSDEKMMAGIKQFLKNSAFEGRTDAQTAAVPQKDRWNAMANQADRLSKSADAWKVFQGAGCNFGFTPKAEKAGQLKQMLELQRDELRDPAAAKFNKDF